MRWHFGVMYHSMTSNISMFFRQTWFPTELVSVAFVCSLVALKMFYCLFTAKWKVKCRVDLCFSVNRDPHTFTLITHYLFHTLLGLTQRLWFQFINYFFLHFVLPNAVAFPFHALFLWLFITSSQDWETRPSIKSLYLAGNLDPPIKNIIWSAQSKLRVCVRACVHLPSCVIHPWRFKHLAQQTRSCVAVWENVQHRLAFREESLGFLLPNGLRYNSMLTQLRYQCRL